MLMVGIISIKEFGAKCNWNGVTGTDDANAINKCAIYCRTNGLVLYIPTGTRCLIKSQIDLTGISVNMQGKIIVDNTVLKNGIAVRLGATAVKHLNEKDIIINVDNSSKNWTNTVTGVQIKNLHRCKVKIVSIKWFKLGLHYTAEGTGNGWNQIEVMRVSDNDTNLLVDTLDEAGWTNENIFYGGDFQGATTGILIGTTDSTLRAPNHNVFIQPDLSSNGTGIRFLSGLKNRIQSLRCELVTNIATFETLAFSNYVEVGWDVNIRYTDNAKNGTNKLMRQDNARNYYSILEPNGFKHAYFEAGSVLHVPGYSIRHYSSSAVYKERDVAGENLAINPNYIQLSQWNAVGLRVKTDLVKNFKLATHSQIAEDAANIRFVIVCFDASGNRLTGNTPFYVQGAKWLSRVNEIFTTPNYGGAYIFIPATSSYEFSYGIAEGYICFDSTVSSAWIGVVGSSSRSKYANVSGFNIFVDTPIIPITYPDYTGVIEYPSTQEVLKGTTANRPTNPRQGQRYYDTTLVPVNGKPIEWNGSAWIDGTGATV